MPLNPTLAQRAIYDFIEHGKGNGIIDAVAGAGKTTTLMACMVHTPNINDVIFCAFNRSIRDEIHKRLHRNKKDVRVCTIHSLGFQLLRTNGKYKLDDNKFSKIIKDPEFINSIEYELDKILSFHSCPSIKELRSNSSNMSKEFFDGRKLMSVIVSRLLDINLKYRSTLTGSSMEEYEKLDNHFNFFAPPHNNKKNKLSDELWSVSYPNEFICYINAHQALITRGNEFALSKGIIDFTDQLYLPYIYNLTSKNKYGFVFVDECQDLSPAQLYVVKQYLRSDGRLLAVGDPYQAIYGFAGADCGSFQRIQDTFGCTSLGLTDCFRCPQTVIQLAQTIRPDIKGFKTEPGSVITILNDKAEEYINSGDLVICRFRDPLLKLSMSLVNRNLKVKIHPDELDLFIGDYKKNFKLNELKEILTEDTVEDFFELILQKGIRRIQRENKDVDPSLKEQIIINETGFLQETLEFLKLKFFDWQLNTIESILKRLKNMLSCPDNDAIKISTIHRAKGLENKRVFILKYDSLPFLGRCTQEWERIQEHNLHYVAVTRAKENLFLCVESLDSQDLAPLPLTEELKDEAEHEAEVLLPVINNAEDINIVSTSPVLPPVIQSLGRSIDFRPMQKLSRISDRFYAFAVYEDTPYSAINHNTFQKAKYWSINDHLQDTEFSISNVVCMQYMDVYSINTPNGIEIYRGTYRQTGQYNFVPQGNCINADQLMCYLTDESNYKIWFEYQPQNQGFDAVHGLITATCNDLGICITNIYGENNTWVYCLKTPSSYSYVKLIYNKRHTITTITPFSSIGTADEKINALLESLKHLWQR